MSRRRLDIKRGEGKRGGEPSVENTLHSKGTPVNLHEFHVRCRIDEMTIKSVRNFIVRNIFWLITAISIPLVTVGYDYLEQTNFYNKITLTTELREAVKELYNGDEKSNGFLSSRDPTTDKNFQLILRIIDIKDFSSENLYPQFISRFAVTNAAYVSVPSTLDENAKFFNGQTSTSSNKIYIGTDDSPTIVAYCPMIITDKSDFSVCRMQKVGDREVFNNLIEDRKKKIRQNFNFVITLIGIGIAISLSRKQSKNS